MEERKPLPLPEDQEATPEAMAGKRPRLQAPGVKAQRWRYIDDSVDGKKGEEEEGAGKKRKRKRHHPEVTAELTQEMCKEKADAAKREQADAAKRRAIENFEAFRNNCLIEGELLQVISRGAQDQFV